MLGSIGKQSGESVELVLTKKRKATWEGFAEKEGFKPGVERVIFPSAPCSTVQCIQETLLPQTDRATRYVSQNLVNCRNKLYNKSTTNRSNGVRGLQLADDDEFC